MSFRLMDDSFCKYTIFFLTSSISHTYFYISRFHNLASSKSPPTHEIAVQPVETRHGELSTESIDNRLCDEVVQHSACASQETKAKQKTLSAKVGSKKNRNPPVTGNLSKSPPTLLTCMLRFQGRRPTGSLYFWHRRLWV